MNTLNDVPATRSEDLAPASLFIVDDFLAHEKRPGQEGRGPATVVARTGMSVGGLPLPDRDERSAADEVVRRMVMQGWNYQAPERGGGSGGTGTWLKLANDGDTAVVAFLGEPHGREVVFDGGKYVPFTDAHKQQGLEPKVRMAVNVALLATKEVKVLEMSYALFRDIVALKNKFGLTDWGYEIKRTGKPKDPKTVYHILPERQLSADEKAWMATAKFVDLKRMYDGDPGDARQHDAGLAQLVGRLGREAQQQFFARFGVKSLVELSPVLLPKALEYARELASAPTPSSTSDTSKSTDATQTVAMIDDASVAMLVADLRRLPQDQVTEWLKHCGVQRVRDLPVERVPAAREFLALLMKEFGPATAPIDPFA